VREVRNVKFRARQSHARRCYRRRWRIANTWDPAGTACADINLLLREEKSWASTAAALRHGLVPWRGPPPAPSPATHTMQRAIPSERPFGGPSPKSVGLVAANLLPREISLEHNDVAAPLGGGESQSTQPGAGVYRIERDSSH
jgi:hypothetical protein